MCSAIITADLLWLLSLRKIAISPDFCNAALLNKALSPSSMVEP